LECRYAIYARGHVTCMCFAQIHSRTSENICHFASGLYIIFSRKGSSSPLFFFLAWKSHNFEQLQAITSFFFHYCERLDICGWPHSQESHCTHATMGIDQCGIRMEFRCDYLVTLQAPAKSCTAMCGHVRPCTTMHHPARTHVVATITVDMTVAFGHNAGTCAILCSHVWPSATRRNPVRPHAGGTHSRNQLPCPHDYGNWQEQCHDMLWITLWPLVTLRAPVWSCMAMRGHVQPCVTPHGHMRVAPI